MPAPNFSDLTGMEQWRTMDSQSWESGISWLMAGIRQPCGRQQVATGKASLTSRLKEIKGHRFECLEAMQIGELRLTYS